MDAVRAVVSNRVPALVAAARRPSHGSPWPRRGGTSVHSTPVGLENRSCYAAHESEAEMKPPTRVSGSAAPLSRARCELVEGTAVEDRSEEHTSELQSPCNLVCRLLLEKKK